MRHSQATPSLPHKAENRINRRRLAPSQGPAFTIRVLHHDHTNADASQREEPPTWLLPAAYRTDQDDLMPPRPDNTTCIAQELDLRRLTDIAGGLWWAGRPTPPRALHHQVYLGRDICVTERMDMHLVWSTGRIFLKPIPRFLLEPAFWETQLSCPENCPHPHDVQKTGPLLLEGCKQGLRAAAYGFLYSYSALICHESDYWLALEKHLLPHEVRWPAWRILVREILATEHIYVEIHPRFVYGELRLSRLNKIYMITGRSVQGYVERWQQYSGFFQDNFAWLASVTVYLAIVLSAMQVGLGTALNEDEAFQSVSYGFTVFSIVGPLAVIVLIVFVVCFMFMINLVKTINYKNKRLHTIEGGVQG